jgi:hypothetical protein
VPRYFFNFRGDDVHIDDEGTDLTSRDAARIAGLRLAAEVLKEEANRRRLGHAWNLKVLDEEGLIVCCVDVRVSVPATSD